MKLALIELSTKNHYSLIYNWIKVANINGWEVVLFTTTSIYEATKEAYSGLNYDVELLEKTGFNDIRKLKTKIVELGVDQTSLLTMQSHFLEFYFSGIFSLKYGITVHNTNLWFKNNVIRKPVDILKRYIRQSIRKRASFFVVNSSNMYASIDKGNKIKQPVYIMPFSLKRQEVTKQKKHENKPFTLVYPGMLNVQRKNYDMFIKLALQHPTDQFIVLGAPSKDNKSLEIYRKMKNISNIDLYDGFIPLEEFTKIMSEADILYSDIITKFNASDTSEIYGQTKDSGISYLMIEYTLLCLLNSTFENLKELRSGSFYFHDFKELALKYRELKDETIREKAINTMKQELEDFTFDVFSYKLKRLEDLV